MDNLFKERQVAQILNNTVGTLHVWRHRGQGPKFVKVGRSVRYRPADVEKFINENVKGGAR
jgi:predicted DNA-binding transcriptional regulator AlpA